ncbi:c-type cytochrome [Microbulbifer sp. SAOS-129_SWC]|uniref:c-type cytochrome n=1 Tax=Microbulbifer sp. SAOS-129_SWC TaxID=3145235 RepID=UPI003216EB6C
MKRLVWIYALLVTAALLMACSRGDAAPEPRAQAQGDGDAGPTAAAEIRQVYWRTCHSCHGAGVGGAPRAGDAAAWAPRLAQGMDTLVDHAVHGYRAMPPRGLCFDCSEAEFAALITLMSNGAEIAAPE